MRTSVPTLPAASRALTVITLVPVCSATEATAQLVVPDAVPAAPTLDAQVTCVTPPSSDAIPLNESVADVVL